MEHLIQNLSKKYQIKIFKIPRCINRRHKFFFYFLGNEAPLDSERTLVNIGQLLTSPVCPIHSVAQQHFQRYRGLLLFRQYYLEGGWGYMVLLCAFLSVMIASGAQLSLVFIPFEMNAHFKIAWTMEFCHQSGKAWKLFSTTQRLPQFRGKRFIVDQE